MKNFVCIEKSSKNKNTIIKLSLKQKLIGAFGCNNFQAVRTFL